jgi:hypothetical protein
MTKDTRPNFHDFGLRMDKRHCLLLDKLPSQLQRPAEAHLSRIIFYTTSGN